MSFYGKLLGIEHPKIGVNEVVGYMNEIHHSQFTVEHAQSKIGNESQSDKDEFQALIDKMNAQPTETRMAWMLELYLVLSLADADDEYLSVAGFKTRMGIA